MSEEKLESLMETLMEIPLEDVDAPGIPMAVVLQEASDLLTVIREDEIWQTLTSVGLEAGVRDQLDTAVDAARTAQSQWVVVRDRKKSEAQREREEHAEKLRLDLLAAARFNLRRDRGALGTLSAISAGEGIADLIQDLSDLAELVERKRGAFDRDRTFDATAAVERARSLSSELSTGIAIGRLPGDQARAKELRDRAFTHLDDIVSEIREAGRYAFRGRDEVRRRFVSRYLRRKRRRRGEDEAEVPNAPAK